MTGRTGVPALLADAVAARREALGGDRFTERLLAGDTSLWPDPETSASRLGWLRLPSSMRVELEEIVALAEEIRAEGVKDVVVLGMGGSSLAPEVFDALLRAPEATPRLTVLDSTHPAVVAAHLEAFPPSESVYVVSSKSGTTVETLSFFRSFWRAAGERDAGHRFIAVTDPGTPLAELGAERGFRRVFLADPEVGGRFSALSHFGLVPAALVGADLSELLAGGEEGLARAGEAVDLGLLLGEAARAGRDKVTFVADPALAPFVSWLEQLLAESTGKHGQGLLPVFGEPSDVRFGDDRLFVGLSLAGGARDVAAAVRSLGESGLPAVELEWDGPESVAVEMMRWQLATAVAAAVLGLQPFDQPDVDLTKELTRAAMEGGSTAAEDDPPVVDLSDRARLERAMGEWLAGATSGDAIAMQAFLPETEETLATLASLRTQLAATGLPTTLGFGPRYLHSTGQLHKGGPPGLYCLQLIDRGGPELAVPRAGYSYRQLIDAQALGDARALARRGRKVLRLRLGD